MKENIKKNFIWNTIGSLLFGFTSLFFLVIITRINGVEWAGIFSYAFAVACIMYCIAQYSGKTFQITETNKEITDSDYLYNRLITYIITIGIAFLFCIIAKQEYNKFVLIILLSIYRATDAYIDSIHSIIQRNGYLYKVGKSLFFKTIILIGIFLIADKLTNNLILSVTTIVLINLIFAYFIDYKIAKNMIQKSKFNKEHNRYLFKTGFALFGYNFLSVYVMNVPKYVIEYFSTNEIQAIFSIIIMPASFLSLIAIYLVQPFLGIITNEVKKNNIKELKNIIIKLTISIIGIGILALLACYILGIPVLELVYNMNLSTQKINLMIIIFGSIFYSLVVMLSAILIAMRKNAVQLIILLVTALFSTIICIICTSKFGIKGSSIAYTLVMIFEFICYLIALQINLKKCKSNIQEVE